MNAPAAGLLTVFALAAVCDWVAVHRNKTALEYLCKPVALLALFGAALALDVASDERRAWFVVALAFSLAGDVFLMLPRTRAASDGRGTGGFVAGLSSFLVAHLAYIAGFVAGDVDVFAVAVGVVVLGAALSPLALRIVSGARARDPRLGLAVAVYIVVIAAMGGFAVGAEVPVAAAGALIFMASDSLIGWNRFVTPLAWAPVTIMVTYHTAQLLLVLSLI